MWQSISYYALLALECLAGMFGIRLYEEPQYKLLDRVGERVEIRRYAPRVAAEVTLPNTGKDARGDAFQLLFDYISGANRGTSGSDKIAMTVPVAVRDRELISMTVPVAISGRNGSLRMRFFLPAIYDIRNAPRPIDERVELNPIPAQTVGTLRYSGSGRDAHAQESKLIAALKGSAWQALGPAYTLYYDAPFTLPFLRRNEAAVGVGEAR